MLPQQLGQHINWPILQSLLCSQDLLRLPGLCSVDYRGAGLVYTMMQLELSHTCPIAPMNPLVGSVP